MPVERVSDKIAPMIQASLERHALGESILWETALAPRNQGAAMMLSLTMTGAVLGTQIQTLTVLPPVNVLTEDAIDPFVKEAVEDLRQARSQQVEVPLHGGNGHGPGLNALGG